VSASSSLLLLGGGGHAAVVADAAQRAGFNILGYLDDAQSGTSPSGPPMLRRLGGIDDLARVLGAHNEETTIHAAIGDAALRRAWLDAAPHTVAATVIHPSAIIAETADIADGCFIGPGAIINPRARLERGVIINSGAIVEHDCVVGSFSHVAPRAILAGDVTVGINTLVGAGAVVIPGIHIGAGATIGAGAVVVSPVVDGITVTGVPAKPEVGRG